MLALVTYTSRRLCRLKKKLLLSACSLLWLKSLHIGERKSKTGGVRLREECSRALHGLSIFALEN